jgi:AAA15 family ATPase/GTPase
MLKKFKVSNFKGFQDIFELDLSDSRQYEFNKSSVKNGIVNNAIVYGKNGVGKSNLALAIFDIIKNLTDKNTNDEDYQNYLNAHSKHEFAAFYYEFEFNKKTVIYEYRKSDYKTIIYESLRIDGIEVVTSDRSVTNTAYVLLAGAENLKTTIDNHQLSVIRYIKNNTVLVDNPINFLFNEFVKFVDKMLYFRSLQDRKYYGLTVGNSDVLENIISLGKVKDFENFMNKAGIECKFQVVKESGRDTIAFDFEGKYLPFEQVASTGTDALTLFYFWLQSIRENGSVSFVFIDEFDAFYHHELSAMVVEYLKESNVQFILSTHNTSIMTNDLLRPDCYFVMYKDRVKSLPNLTQKELREAHNIEKMYKAGSFDEQ